MSRRLMINNAIDNDIVVLCKNYSPNEEKFYLWQDKPIYLDENELYVNVDFTNCKTTIVENVLSVGLDIVKWQGYNMHIYYRRGSNSLEVNCLDTNARLCFTLSLKSLINEIVINKDGIFINNIPQNFNKDSVQYKNVMNKLFNDGVSIGSQEGVGRSNATYNLVCLRKYQKRGDQV